MDTARGRGLAPSLPTSLTQAESPRPQGITHGPQDAALEAVWCLNLKKWKKHVSQSPEPNCNNSESFENQVQRTESKVRPQGRALPLLGASMAGWLQALVWGHRAGGWESPASEQH